MARRPRVEHIKQSFLREIWSAHNLVDAVAQLPISISPSDDNHPSFHPRYQEQVVSLAFMAVVTAWHEFLELSFVRYMAGAYTANGYAPRPKFGQANTIKAAYKILAFDPNFDPNRRYLDFGNPTWVFERADFFFSQHPYQGLQKYNQLLQNANKIRNRIAHNSQKSKSDFKEVALWFLQPSSGRLRQGFSPGVLLMRIAQRHFPTNILDNNVSHFEAYVQLFRMLANQIVP